jgi:hypothetical protein
MVNREVDSASVKLFSNNSTIYALGGNQSSKSTLLNRKVGVFCIDEFDRQDLDVITGFTSRTTHVKDEEQLRLYISTPTVANYGIDNEFEECRFKHFAYVKCLDCGHSFQGDFYKHVVLPGFEKNLRYLTKFEASKLDTSSAFLQCPECKAKLSKDNRATEWVVEENLDGVRGKIGVALDPFVAPAFISMKKLIEASFTYSNLTEFLNQSLGKVAELNDSTVSVSHIHFQHDESPGLPIAGLDLGKTNYWIRGYLKYDTTIHIAEIELVPLSSLREFVQQQFRKHYFAAVVMDSMPYTSLVYELVKEFPQMFSAIYVDPPTPKPELFTLSMQDKHGEVVRQVSINKNLAMGNLADGLNDFYTFEPTMHKELLVKHFTDMRKVRDYRFEEYRQKWVKSTQADDHLWHSTVYLSMAAKLAQAGLSQRPALFMGIKKLKVGQV